MSNNIATLAAIKSFYDDGSDLIDVFANLVILGFINEDTFLIEDILKIINEQYGINIPLDALKTILKRLHRNNFVEYKNLQTKSIRLTEKGIVKQNSIKGGLRTIERENNALIEDIKKYLKEKFNEDIETDKILEELRRFIKESTKEATLILIDGQKSEFSFNGIHKYLIDFFSDSEGSNPVNFERLKSILYGEIIKNSLLSNNFSVDAKFKGLDVYLDTNMVFSLMKLHEDVFNKSTIELINIINGLGMHLKIFNFTKEEIVSTLNGYLEEFQYYSNKIKVNTIYHVLKRKGYSKQDVMLLIEDIEKKLNDLGVEIDYSFIQKNLLNNQESIIEKLENCKSDKGMQSIKHDIASILAIKELRKGNVYFLEKANYIFLSADYRLALFNNREFNHKNTIPEVILRGQLTSILWLKKIKDQDNAFVHNILISQIHENFISSSLWEKFINELKNRQTLGYISDEDICLIINQNETETILKENRESGIDIILDSERIEKLRKANYFREQKNTENEIALKQKTVALLNIDKELEDSQNIIKKQNDLFEKVGKNIEEECRNEWVCIINYLIWIISGLTLSVVIILYFYFEIYLFLGLPALIIFYAIICVALEIRLKKRMIPEIIKQLLFPSLDFIKIRNNFENKKIQKCINKKRIKIGLND